MVPQTLQPHEEDHDVMHHPPVVSTYRTLGEGPLFADMQNRK